MDSFCDWSDDWSFTAADPEYARCAFPTGWGCDYSEQPFGSKTHYPTLKNGETVGPLTCWDNIELGCGDSIIEPDYAWGPMNLEEGEDAGGDFWQWIGVDKDQLEEDLAAAKEQLESELEELKDAGEQLQRDFGDAIESA